MENLLFEIDEKPMRRKLPFIERIKPFLKVRPLIRTYFGAPQKELGELLAQIGIGACISPTTKKHFDSYAFYFLDNGAFRYWRKGEKFDERPFLNLIDISLKAKRKADFLVLPDLIGEGVKSLEFSGSYAERLRGVGIPFALALQDGMEEKDVREFVETYNVKVLFVGGTTEWKWRTAPKWRKLAKELSVVCHIGRVPSAKRVKQARRIGVDSIDTTAALWEERKMVNYLKALSERLPEHPELWKNNT